MNIYFYVKVWQEIFCKLDASDIPGHSGYWEEEMEMFEVALAQETWDRGSLEVKGL